MYTSDNAIGMKIKDANYNLLDSTYDIFYIEYNTGDTLEATNGTGAEGKTWLKYPQPDSIVKGAYYHRD